MIEFKENDHSYWHGGRQLPSVNQILRELEVYSYTDIDPWYAERGTAVHKATELWDQGNLNPLTLDDQIAGYLDAWKRFTMDIKTKEWKRFTTERTSDNKTRVVGTDWEHINFVAIEQIVHHERLGYAGTVDRVCVAEDSNSSRAFVLDIKTSRQKSKWHALQVDGYMKALGLEGKGAVVYLRADGEYKLDMLGGVDVNFESFAEVYNWKQSSKRK